jgi:alkyl sulfatase BDS1-like metallo-beta-lactamase superfamily hydrolase
MPIPDPFYLTRDNLSFTDESETVADALTAHALTMEQGVYQVAGDFFVAVGYGNANMSMVVGTDGVILIDSMETADAAKKAMSDLRRASDKPVKALIYTHSHPDHSSGARGLFDPAEVEERQVEIYAHEQLTRVIRGNPSLGIVPPLRLAYQFGFGLDRGEDGLVEVGLGPLLHVGNNGFLPPTTTFSGSIDIQIAGINLQLHEAPSESDDEIVIWFPDHRVLHVADVIQGETLPNLYALRGAVRDPWQWIDAVDLLRSFDAESLLLGHGRPLTGRNEIEDLLRSYRDAMQFIHDQAVRLMARGMTPDEIAEVVAELPSRLRDHPWLGEFYGTVKQTVRQIYHNNFGWFEGDPTFVDPLPRAERSTRYVDAMGGADAVLANATAARDDGDFRWAAEILTHLLRVDPDNRRAREIKAEALRALGYQATNPIWRNFYLMSAKELDGSLDRPGLQAKLRELSNPDVAAMIPIPLLLRALATRLNPVKSEGQWFQVRFDCTDTNASYGLEVRYDVVDMLQKAPEDAALAVQTTETTLRGLLSGRSPWTSAVDDGSATLTIGSADEAKRFWGLFDTLPGELPALALR